MFKVLDLEQGSEEWLKWRDLGVTATDMVVLYGSSPHKTTWRCWAEKVGYCQPQDLSGNPLVRHGLQHEDDARAAMEVVLDDILLPVCIESTVPGKQHLRASLDGITEKNEPVEIKCPSESVWADVETNGTASAAYKMYEVQVQYQMFVTGSEKGYLVFWKDGDILYFEVRLSEVRKAMFLNLARDFWDRVKNRKEPNKDIDRDIFYPPLDRKESWEMCAGDLKLVQGEIDSLQAKIDRLNEKKRGLVDSLVAQMGDFRRGDFSGVEVTRYQRSGSIDTKLLASKFNLEHHQIESCRKQGSESTRVKVKESLAPRDVVDADVVDAANSNSYTKSWWIP
tara:strand:+ start:2135 stop:3148 length:1014 start_codon:yes stop_codon:yes gene_type:complete